MIQGVDGVESPDGWPVPFMTDIHPQQRVMMALNHQMPDRVPLIEGFWSEFITKWRREKGLPVSADIYEYYGHDIRRQAGLIADQSPWPSKAGDIKRSNEYVIRRDGWGRVLKHITSATTLDQELAHPMTGPCDLDRIEFESPCLDSRYEGLAAAVAEERKNYCVFFKTGGPYSRTARFSGTMQFLTDMLLDAGFVKELTHRMTDLLIATTLEGLKRGHLPQTAVWIADDIASTKALFFSPRIYEDIFFPELRRLCAAIRKTGRKVIYESEGNTSEVLDMIVDAGADALACLEPRAGMDIARLKRKYGSRVSFVGNICNVIVLPRGSKQDIEKEVLRVLSVAEDGGYIAGSAHSIGADVPVESYDYMVKLIREYGTYPLRR